MNGGNTVSPGDTWRPTAAWINAVNRLLVLFGGRTGDSPVSATRGMGQRVAVYNAGSAALAAGQAVELISSGAEMVGSMIPCSALTDTNKRWGVLTNYLEPKQCGGCVIAGPVSVSSITGAGGECVLPVTGAGAIVSGAQVWSRTSAGTPLIAGTASGGIVIIGASPTATPTYSSYFKLSLVSGATVTIADGATGSDSIAVVNGGSTYSLPPYSEVVSGARVFCLKYTPAQFNSSGAVISGATMVISSVAGGTLPSGGTSGAYYMQLGRTVGSGAELHVVQDHTAGVAQFTWYMACWNR